MRFSSGPLLLAAGSLQLCTLPAAGQGGGGQPVYPGESWQTRSPEQEDMSSELLERAFAYAGEPQ